MCNLHELCEKAIQYREKSDIYNMEKLINDLEKDYKNETEFKILKVKQLTDKLLLDESLDILNDIIKSEPQNEEAYFLKGQIEMSRGQIDECYKDFLKAHEIEPKKNDVKEYLSKALIDLRRFEEARDLLKEVYRYSKTDKNISYFESCNEYVIEELEGKENIDTKEKISLAKSYYSLSRTDDALKLIESIDDIDNSVEGLLAYFNILNYFKNYIKAENVIDKALMLNSDNLRANLYKGIALEHNLKYEEAEQVFKKLIEKDKDFEPSYNRLARVLNKLGKYDESIEISKKALENKFDREVTYNNIGISNYYLENYDEAVKAYNKAISIYPAYLDSYLNKSRLYRDNERYKEAMDSCNEAMDLGHKNEKIALEKSYILNSVDQNEDALEWLNWGIDMQDKDERLYCLKGICLCSLERYSEAIEAMEKVIELSGKDIIAYSGLMHVYYCMKNTVKVKDIFNMQDDYLKEMSKSRSVLKDDKIYYILRNTAISCKQMLREVQ